MYPQTIRLLIGLAVVTACSTTRAQAQAAVTPVPEVKSPWESSAALGFTLTRGNSKTLLFTASAVASRKEKMNELSFGADATYGESTDTKTDVTTKNANAVHGFIQYNRLFNERLYGYARLDGLHDDIADIAYRISFSPGLGYYFIKNDKTLLSGEVGPGVINEKTGSGTDTYATIRLAERLEHKFNPTVKLWQSFELLPQVDRFSNYILNSEIGVEAALSKQMSLRTYLQDSYDNEPAAGRKRNDLKLVTALAYKF